MWVEVFCTVFAILLCSVWAIGRYLLVVDDFVYIPTTRKRHSWRSIKLLSSAMYCSVCEMMLMPSAGHFCDCCGVCADSARCLRLVDQRHRCKETFATATSAPSESTASLSAESESGTTSTSLLAGAAASTPNLTTPTTEPQPTPNNRTPQQLHRNEHLWVHGNLPLHQLCAVCGDDLDQYIHAAEPGLHGYRCCWCQRAVHTECHHTAAETNSSAAVGSACDFGEFRSMVIPPSCVEAVVARGRRRIKLSAPDALVVGNWRPLFVVANSKSGDSSSAEAVSLFRGLLHPLQVTELGYRGPRAALRLLAKLPAGTQARLLVAGGDGTVGWILNTVRDMQLPDPQPQIAVLPTGTGNDLARVLGWGAAPPAQLQPAEWLWRIAAADKQTLDRWRVRVAPTPLRRRIPALQWTVPAVQTRQMYNYVSVGVDAQVALCFHQARQSNAYVFSSRVINKILYLCFGTQQVMQPDCAGLEQHVDVYLDGELVRLPEVQSIVCLNIDSWGAGVKLWEMSTPPEQPNTHSTSDGQMEVLAIVSSFHIAQLQVGLSKPIRLGQARNVKLVLRQPYPVQVDGEPWMQAPSEITIEHSGQANMLKCTQSA